MRFRKKSNSKILKFENIRNRFRSSQDSLVLLKLEGIFSKFRGLPKLQGNFRGVNHLPRPRRIFEEVKDLFDHRKQEQVKKTVKKIVKKLSNKKLIPHEKILIQKVNGKTVFLDFRSFYFFLHSCHSRQWDTLLTTVQKNCWRKKLLNKKIITNFL